MTREEARAYLKEVADMPSSEIDEEKLADAMAVLQDAAKDTRFGLAGALDEIWNILSYGFSDNRIPSSSGEWLQWIGSLGSSEIIKDVASTVGRLFDSAEETGEPASSGAVAAEAASQAETMTPEAARDFIESSESKPSGEIDQTRLSAAIRVLQENLPAGKGRTDPEAGWLNRGFALAQRTAMLPSVGPPGSTAGQDAGVTPSTAPPLPGDIEARYRAAAADAGMTPGQVDLELTNARVVAASGEPGAAEMVTLQLEAEIEALKAEAQAGGPRPIGVAPDFVAQRPVTHRPGDIGMGGPGSYVRPVDPRYFDGDEFSPAGLSPEQVTQIQSRLEAAGLLNPGEYWAGTWDDVSSSAYKRALGMANASGTTVDRQIDQLVATLPESVKEQRARAEAAEMFSADPYITRDKDALAQRVKDEIRRTIGREPTPEDLAWGVSALGDEYRAQYESQVAAARAEFEAARGESVGGETIQGVDPVSSFRERLEQRFGPEIDRLAALPEVRENMNNVFGSMRTMESLIG